MKSLLPKWVQQELPTAQWLADYQRADLRSDLVAGITVGVMLIPQAMAYAVIAGVPPIYGLYAALVPPLVYPLLGSSRHLSVGPVALDMLIVAAGVGAVATTGTAEYIALAVVLTAMAGVLQIAMGAAQLGFVANLLSRPVITGITTAAALIIGFSQLGNLLGIEVPNTQYVHVLIRAVVQQAGAIDPTTCAIGGISIAALVLLRWWRPLWPEALIVVVGATLASWGLDLHAEGVATVGRIPDGLPPLVLPDVSPDALRTLLPAALTLALVQFMNSVSLGRVFAARHNYAIDPNRELFGIGAANLAGSFFNAVPASGSFSRSAVNEQTGARTPMANIFTAAVIALTLLFLTPLFYYLPMAALAAIIMVAGFGLIDLSEVRKLFQAKRRDGVIALFTAGSILTIGIQEGILIGIAASMTAVLYQISRPNMVELGHVPGTRLFRDLERFDQAVRIEGVLILRVDAAFSFANAEFFKDFILEKSEYEGRQIDVVIIDGTSINDLDTTAIDALRAVVETLQAWDIDIHFTGLIGPVREVVRRSGLYDLMGGDRFHMSPHDAVMQVLEEWDETDSGGRADRYLRTTEPERKETTPVGS